MPVHPAAGDADKESPGRGLAAVRHCGGQRNVALKGAQAQTGRYFIVGQSQ